MYNSNAEGLAIRGPRYALFAHNPNGQTLATHPISPHLQAQSKVEILHLLHHALPLSFLHGHLRCLRCSVYPKARTEPTRVDPVGEHGQGYPIGHRTRRRQRHHRLLHLLPSDTCGLEPTASPEEENWRYGHLHDRSSVRQQQPSRNETSNN